MIIIDLPYFFIINTDILVISSVGLVFAFGGQCFKLKTTLFFFYFFIDFIIFIDLSNFYL
jgi:hypothetical protein